MKHTEILDQLKRPVKRIPFHKPIYIEWHIGGVLGYTKTEWRPKNLWYHIKRALRLGLCP